MTIALIIGFLLGFISAVPVAGPISALVFSRGLRGRFSEGKSIALGAGLAEGIYTFVAFWGFHEFLSKISWVFATSQIIGAFILVLLGFYFYFSKRLRDLKTISAHEPKQYPRGFLTGFILTLINPSIIATWTAAITTFYAVSPFQYETQNFITFSLGVALGIYFWFATFLYLLKKVRGDLRPHWVDRSLKAMGIGLLILATFMLYRLL